MAPSWVGLPSVAYQKIATLLVFTESTVSVGEAASIIRAIEMFGAGVGQWLKVAADSKAELLEACMFVRRGWSTEICVELGTYVGYTAVRLARWVSTSCMSPSRSVSLEVDPVHVLLAKHHLSLAKLTHRVDVWVGQALDSIPRLAEEFGAKSSALTFMDHRGTKFHSDLFRLHRIEALSDLSIHVCDNTLKPGAPLLMWDASYRQCDDKDKSVMLSWALNEFAHWNSEDWMFVSVEVGNAVLHRGFD